MPETILGTVSSTCSSQFWPSVRMVATSCREATIRDTRPAVRRASRLRPDCTPFRQAVMPLSSATITVLSPPCRDSERRPLRRAAEPNASTAFICWVARRRSTPSHRRYRNFFDGEADSLAISRFSLPLVPLHSLHRPDARAPKYLSTQAQFTGWQGCRPLKNTPFQVTMS